MPDLTPDDPSSRAPENGPGAAFRKMLRRALWLLAFIAAAYGALIIAWVLLNPRI